MPEIPSIQSALISKETGEPAVQIHFPNITITQPGLALTKEQSKPRPTLSISSKLAKSPAAKYIAIALDLDAPFPSLAILSPILHGIEADLSIEGEPDAEGWVKLLAGTKAVVPWGPPGPPPLSGPHRYVFLVWEQPEGLTNEKIRTSLGISKEISRTARMKWKQDHCEEKLGLKDCLGGNYFVV